MSRKSKSPLADEAKLREAISVSNSAKNVLENLGLRAGGGNYAQLNKYCEKFGIELIAYNNSAIGKFFKSTVKIANDKVFIENSTYNSGVSIKKRLYEMGVKEECTACGLGNEWNGKPISLQLEHINGIHDDNRLENLTILCPNCHSQTSTFAGRSKSVVYIPVICQCGKEIHKKSKRCISCALVIRHNSDSKYPDLETLKQMIKDYGYVGTGKKLGVSDNAVRKRIKKLSAL